MRYGVWRLGRKQIYIPNQAMGLKVVGMVVVGVVILIKVIKRCFSVIGTFEQRLDWSKWMSQVNIWVKFCLGRGNCKHKYLKIGISLTWKHLAYSKSAGILAPNNQAGELNKWHGSGDKKMDGD